MSMQYALWADSTYGSLEEKRALGVAEELGFPLCSFSCVYGAGLCTKGDGSGADRKVADTVILEFGYNDDEHLSPEEATKRMRRQGWFETLRRDAAAVRRVIFVEQPTYRQVAAARKRKKASQWTRGDYVRGSKYTAQAIALLRAELPASLEVETLEVPAEELFRGFVRDAAGELWQDESTCRSYADHGVDHAADGSVALWYDALHPSAAGAEAHLRLLIAAIVARFSDGKQASPTRGMEEVIQVSEVENRTWDSAADAQGGQHRSSPRQRNHASDAGWKMYERRREWTSDDAGWKKCNADDDWKASGYDRNNWKRRSNGYNGSGWRWS